MAKKLVSKKHTEKQGSATVSREVRAGGETVREHSDIFRTASKPVPEVHALVSLSGGVTQAIPDRKFEFIRVDVSLQLPCAVEDVDAVADEISEWVDKRINSELDLALGKEG